MPNWNAAVVGEFRANGGKVASFGKQPLVLLHTIGAKSGEERVNPLACLRRGDTLYVFATFAGRPVNPAWYHNLKAHPDVTVETGVETFAATAVELTGDQRNEVYAEQAAFNPGFAEYQEKTTRVIPVIALRRA